VAKNVTIFVLNLTLSNINRFSQLVVTVAHYGHAADFFSLQVRTKTTYTCARRVLSADVKS